MLTIDASAIDARIAATRWRGHFVPVSTKLSNKNGWNKMSLKRGRTKRTLSRSKRSCSSRELTPTLDSFPLRINMMASATRTPPPSKTCQIKMGLRLMSTSIVMRSRTTATSPAGLSALRFSPWRSTATTSGAINVNLTPRKVSPFTKKSVSA